MHFNNTHLFHARTLHNIVYSIQTQKSIKYTQTKQNKTKQNKTKDKDKKNKQTSKPITIELFQPKKRKQKKKYTQTNKKISTHTFKIQ